MTRDEADGGEITRTCLAGVSMRPLAAGDAPGVTEADPPANVADDALREVAVETFAVEFAGTLPFTKRCSLAS